MIKFFTTSLLCCLSLVSLSQVQIEWQKCLGGSGTEVAQSIIQTTDGGYIVAGYSNSIDGHVTGNHGDYDYWVVKLDPIGNVEWQKSYGGTLDDKAYDVRQTAEGGYAVVGYTESNDGDVSGNIGLSNFWLIRLDVLGNLMWQKCYGGTSVNEAYSLQLTYNDGFVLTGLMSSGNLICNSASTDYWVVKTDSLGDMQWNVCIGGPTPLGQGSTDVPYSISQTSDSGYVITGRGMNANNVMTTKLDLNGNIVWQNDFGGSSTIIPYDTGESIKQTSEGGYIISGITTSNDLDVTGNHGLGDVWVLKLDTLGTLLWQKCLGGSDWDWGTDVHETSDGYIVTGYTKSTDGMVSGLHGSAWWDFWVVKIDLQGNFLWQKCLGGSGVERCYSSSLTNDGGSVTAGSTESANGDVTGFLGATDMWVVKLSETTCTISGNAFIDINSNSIKDSNEAYVTNQAIVENNTGLFTLTQQNGNYTLTVIDTGNFLLAPSLLSYYTTVPASHSVYFNSFLQNDPFNDFAFQPTGTFNDLCISISPLGNFRAGMNAAYSINYTNPGTTTQIPEIVFYPDPNLLFISALPVPSIVSQDSIVWNLAALDPYQSGQIQVNLYVNIGATLGTIINSSAVILPLAGDANPACNQAFWEVTTTGPLDPNNILVNRDTLYNLEMASPPFLDYIIQFQNVGNDTSFTVKVVNEISNDLDLSSFEFIDASHSVSTTIHNQLQILEFNFDNILLPDSIVNEPLSHGFIRYRIKPVSTLVVGDSAVNNARIYFDFNDPVYTNDAITRIVLTTAIAETKTESLKIFPNPATNKLHVQFENVPGEETEIEIYSVVGRKVNCNQQSINSNKNSEIVFDTSLLPRGIYFVKPVQNNFKAVRFVKM